MNSGQRMKRAEAGFGTPTGARRALDRLASMVSIIVVLSLAIRTAEFVFCHLLLSLVDHVRGVRAT